MTASLPAGSAPASQPTAPQPSSRLTARLAAGETLLAFLETDLDARLHFAPGLVAVTDRRLLTQAGGEESQEWQEWPLAAGLSLHHHDHAGVGILELFDEHGRLACWRFTLAQNLAALRLVAQFEQRLHTLRTGQPPQADDEAVCPKCKAPLPPGEDDCPICNREATVAPSTLTLLRLWRFARPYRGQLLLGFVLTLASTAATLVPPYLTMPLMDNVLIPFQ
ncbi:MAG: ABC transporter, partial [Azospira sp.]|nr:ABC transporter [Azospira sp.]